MSVGLALRRRSTDQRRRSHDFSSIPREPTTPGRSPGTTPGTPNILRRISWSSDANRSPSSSRHPHRISWSADRHNGQGSFNRQDSKDFDDVFMDTTKAPDNVDPCPLSFITNRPVVQESGDTGRRRSSLGVDDDFLEAFRGYRAREKRRRSTHCLIRPDHTVMDTSRTAVNMAVICVIIGAVVSVVVLLSFLYKRLW